MEEKKEEEREDKKVTMIQGWRSKSKYNGHSILKPATFTLMQLHISVICGGQKINKRLLTTWPGQKLA